ncbi:MAG: AsmA-like C-terminal domain-containing protein, partial [Gammaproteobacteria bacterium]|nr:AsmA-like C-terminal domain-containing protein [Gammaproteobacteria bacterium]
SVSIKDGRIINLSKSTESKLGFGRLLGILSLQSLPRRLTLDFSDLTQKGFGFDTMDGNFELAGGNIQIKKINLDGPAASVKAKGRVDIKKQDYDITLNVVPKITSSIPVAATIVGGPIVGLLTLVADRAITTVMKKTSIYTYRVTGSWAKSDINVAVPAAN